MEIEITTDDLLTPPPLPSKVNKLVITCKVALYEKISESTVLGVKVPQYRILLGRKKDETMWGFLGGKVDSEETLEYAAIRELKEEGNIILSENKLHFLKSFLFKKKEETQSRVMVLFIAPYVGKATAGDDIEECRWWQLEDLDSILLAAYRPVAKVVKEYLYSDGNQYISLNDIFDEI